MSSSRSPATPGSDAGGRRGLPLWATLALSALGYGLMWRWFPLAPNVGRAPAADIRTFAPTALGGLAYALLLMLLFALHLLALRRLRDGLARTDRAALALLIGAALLLALPLLAAYPINATDVYRYVIRGRVASVYGQSPYVAPPATFVGDPFMPLAGEWAGETSPYGPLWELVAAGVTALSGDNLLLGVWLFKLLALACFLGLAALIWALLPPGRARPAYAALWAWNPALLLTFALNGHNDALMLLWLVLGLWVARRRPAGGFLVMALAPLTKPVAALALPFFFLWLWRRCASEDAHSAGAGLNGRALRFAAISVGGALLLAWLAFLPWVGSGGWLRTPFDLALRLAREATASAGFSPAVWVYFALDQRPSIDLIGAVARLLFAVLAAGLLWLGWRGRPALRGVADVFFGYVTQALSFRVWYAVWPFPWLLLDAGAHLDLTGGSVAATPPPVRSAHYRLRAGWWFLVTSQLSVLIYGHLRVFLLDGDQVRAHFISVPFVFLLPWLLARLPLGPMAGRAP
ncbi:polyprenol phosphomannose-dependent alpha 1,6 mannosyltransferase MptB [Promineifilum sp.]|uniref:polyprenol phosphomannose-dependent alpha 1,6 mannosyltransferase MptB n=1 Tax=Promineifilum sp. TaxID=2664178 RepID=UPI0035B2182F